MRSDSFLKLVVDRGLISAEQAEKLSAKHGKATLAILEELIDRYETAKPELCQMYGDTLGVAYLDMTRTIIQPDVVKLLPRDFAVKHQMIAIYRFADSITVAAAEPLNPTVLDDASRLVSMPVNAVFSLPGEIKDAIEVEYSTVAVLQESQAQMGLKHVFVEESEATPQRLAGVAADQSIVQLTRQLLICALRERASDIHIEPSQHEVRVRFRIDGMLQERFQLDRRLLAPLASRLKIMAGCDIAERRRPQDGRIAFELATRSLDVRFSCVPAMDGEKLALRLLGSVRGRPIPLLEELDFSKDCLNTVKQIAANSSGVFFVTGPTGSGKTTTLYSVLKLLNEPRVHIMTVEDPVEYRLPGTTQVQVNEAVDLTFLTTLRSFLRQDPNIILVGEVRDKDTAKIVTQAALTGHLVMTTLHTNSAMQAVTRLIEIGVEPFLVASAVVGVSAQRLVRRICLECREEIPMPKAVAERYFGDVGGRTVSMWHGRGCDACRGTGYSGRLAIHEVFILTDEARRLIAEGATVLDLQPLAEESGYRPMVYDGVKKVLRGLTTLAEVERVTSIPEE
ncbi:MAG TPA: GspE/PulE family protein [Candidatus Paceibacterota bacterium]|nr:GspE/PulE family protein [Verrucomicrobiota bacterium]HSA11143.1 GspE/PulE family protein [Candidatus Paceibacterota bacterium]